MVVEQAHIAASYGVKRKSPSRAHDFNRHSRALEGKCRPNLRWEVSERDAKVVPVEQRAHGPFFHVDLDGNDVIYVENGFVNVHGGFGLSSAGFEYVLASDVNGPPAYCKRCVDVQRRLLVGVDNAYAIQTHSLSRSTRQTERIESFSIIDGRC